MTEVAFHFNVPDKMNYVCRLLRKATQAKARVVVAGPQQALQTLDEALWTLTPQSFVAHCWSSDASPKTDLSPVILKPLDNPSDDSMMPHLSLIHI